MQLYFSMDYYVCRQMGSQSIGYIGHSLILQVCTLI